MQSKKHKETWSKLSAIEFGQFANGVGRRIKGTKTILYTNATLVVDVFRVKYTRQEDANHFKAVLKQDYTVTADWSGTRYIGLTLDWVYNQ